MARLTDFHRQQRAHRRPAVVAAAAASPGEGRLCGGGGYVGEL
jgi:hypothetical protein